MTREDRPPVRTYLYPYLLGGRANHRRVPPLADGQRELRTAHMLRYYWDLADTDQLPDIAEPDYDTVRYERRTILRCGDAQIDGFMATERIGLKDVQPRVLRWLCERSGLAPDRPG